MHLPCPFILCLSLSLVLPTCVYVRVCTYENKRCALDTRALALRDLAFKKHLFKSYWGLRDKILASGLRLR